MYYTAMKYSSEVKPRAEATPDQAMQALIGAARVWDERLEAALASVDLSLSKLGVLTELVNAGGDMTLGELADRIKCVRSNVTQLMDRLEADGLVRRANHESDRRRIRAELTEAGRAKQKAGSEQLNLVHQEFAKSFPASERAALVEALTVPR